LRIVIDDENALRLMCGLNDANIKYIERMCGIDIFYKGNTIEFDGDLPEGQSEVITQLFQQMVDLAQKGYEIDYFQVQLMYDDICKGKGVSFEAPVEHVAIRVDGRIVQPKSSNQRAYLTAMRDRQVVFGIGPAGTGKTFLAIAKALEQLQSGQVHKIVLTRPVVEAGESLGFLPGDLTQKISPYLRPLYDAMEMLISLHTLRKMEEQGVIEIAPLAYMRGRSLQSAFIILDEAQNTTKSQMKMFLTRIGFGAKAVITGDVTQIDLPQKSSSGLLHASRLLDGITGIESVYLNSEDVVRSMLVKRIVDVYEKETETETKT
jgi:phosphate starvation-inducible protein PhoH and related proteins